MLMKANEDSTQFEFELVASWDSNDWVITWKDVRNWVESSFVGAGYNKYQ